MVYLTRRERFNAAHRLYQPLWSPEKNEEVFGKCSQLHGHNFELFVTVKGTPDPFTGFIINVHDLSKIIKEEIKSKVDHTYLNENKDFKIESLPTTENFAIAIWNALESKLNNCKLHCVKLYETENIYVEYFGE